MLIQHIPTLRVFYDIEIYPNMFLVVMKPDFGVIGSRCKIFEISERKDDAEQLFKRLSRSRTRQNKSSTILVGFNNHAYDDHMLIEFMSRYLIGERGLELVHSLKRKNDVIFDVNTKRVRLYNHERFGPKNTLDIMGLMKGSDDSEKGGLKTLAAKAGFENVFDTPYSFQLPVPLEIIDDIIKYCENDVAMTEFLHNKLQSFGTFKMRDYIFDNKLISKMTRLEIWNLNDPGIAERYFADSTYRAKLEPFTVELPIEPENPNLLEFINKYKAEEVIFEDGLTRAPHKLKEKISLGTVEVESVIGALHSNQKTAIAIEDNKGTQQDVVIIHSDVSSMYPTILRNNKIAPNLKKYTKTIEDKNSSKAAGDFQKTAFTKLVLNALTGKLDDKYSRVRNTKNYLTMTFTGQAIISDATYLLHKKLNIHCFNVNTDGVIYTCKRHQIPKVLKIFEHLQKRWNIKFDHERYEWIYQTSVNNYVLKTKSGQKKAIGQKFRKYPHKDAVSNIVEDTSAFLRNALFDWIESGFILDTIKWVKKPRAIREFLFVAGGNLKTEKSDTVNGIRGLRYYFSTDGIPYYYKSGGGWATLGRTNECGISPLFNTKGIVHQTDIENFNYEFYASLINEEKIKIMNLIKEGKVRGEEEKMKMKTLKLKQNFCLKDVKNLSTMQKIEFFIERWSDEQFQTTYDRDQLNLTKWLEPYKNELDKKFEKIKFLRG